jgi:hypothetical protein
MIHRLYIILVLSVFISFAGNAQNMNEEPSLDKIQDATSDVKKYDLVNYQFIADQKYFKNNPDALTNQIASSLEEQLSLKSADHSADDKGINANQIPLDQSHRSISSQEEALDSKFTESAEDKFEEKVGRKQVVSNLPHTIENKKIELVHTSENKSISDKQNIKNTNSQSTNKLTNKDVTTETKKSREQLVVVPVKNEKLIVKNVVDSAKLKAVKELVNAPFIQLNDNHRTITKQKSTQLPKVVEKTPKQVEVKNLYSETSREEKVIDELINSGIYDVYDDGKYIKFSKKK